jgi:uncharacterized membrane protein
MIAVQHTESGRPNSFMDKQSFFYLIFGVTIAFNFLMNSLKNQALKIDFSKLNPQSLWAKAPYALTNLLTGWFDAFIAFINSFLAIVLIGLSRINRNDEQRLDINYNWLLIVGVFLLMILIFYLPLKLLYTNPQNEE